MSPVEHSQSLIPGATRPSNDFLHNLHGWHLSHFSSEIAFPVCSVPVARWRKCQKGGLFPDEMIWD